MSLDNTTAGRAFALTGAALQIALLVALCKLAPTLSNLFFSIFHNGLGDPVALIPAFQEIIEYCALEFTLALIGLVLLCVALVFNRYRARWFFRLLVGYGALLLPVLPVGTAFGLFFLIYSLSHRREFSRMF